MTTDSAQENHQGNSTSTASSRIRELVDDISPASFRSWYREREVRTNIREGKPWRNGPSSVPRPPRHYPHQLNQCHRKIHYRRLNTPQETRPPKGLFWFGSCFEEDVVVPYLEDWIVGSDEYIRNSMWVDYTITADDVDIEIRGSTDPVIVDRESDPILLTEVKTKDDVLRVDQPNLHHKAQLHAYLYGLSQAHDDNVTDGLLIYGGRTSFDLRVFHVTFDPWFWRQTVLAWAAAQTTHQRDGDLPPASPEHSWECGVCDYRNRCGKAEWAGRMRHLRDFSRGSSILSRKSSRCSKRTSRYS
ncbi:PD-(D/E)XK nuclease family protein [Halobacteriaceae archaeon GCM10025711]